MNRWPRAVVAGAGLWSAIALARVLGSVTRITLIDLLLLLAPLVLVPLALTLVSVNTPIAGRLLGWVKMMQPAGAAASVIAFLLPVGEWSGAVALLWVTVCGLSAVSALCFVIELRSLRPAALVPAASFAYLLVGASWLAISRFGLHPQQLPSDIVELTGVHFHYAGFVTLTFASLVMLHTTNRHLAHTLATAASLAVVVSSALIAIGFIVLPVMLVVGALILVTGVITLALVTLAAVVPRTRRGMGRVALIISSLAVFLPMILALSYAAGRVFGLPALGVQEMAAIHGSINAFGFALCGLVGWYELRTDHKDMGS